MSARIEYEWTTEKRGFFTDENGHEGHDVVFLDYLDSLHVLTPAELAAFDGRQNVLGLVRREILPDGGYGNYEYAYTTRCGESLVLPETFSDACGNPGAKIPAKFRVALFNAQRRSAAV